MNTESIREDFRSRVGEQIDLHSEGKSRFAVFTPFRFDDGDHFGIFLKKENGNWILSDEGSTLMHLSYEINDADIEEGKNRGEIIQASLAGFSIENRNGELIVPVSEDKFGEALFTFVQALTKVADVSYLTRERVHSTFLEDFKKFLRSRVSEDRLQFDWYDERHDANHTYPVDARINGMRRPLFVYALPNDDRVKDATISLLTFQKWKIPFRSLGIYEDQASIARQAVAKFTDASEKAYSSLQGNEERISEYLDNVLHARE
jgi:hypothetical protein